MHDDDPVPVLNGQPSCASSNLAIVRQDSHVRAKHSIRRQPRPDIFGPRHSPKVVLGRAVPDGHQHGGGVSGRVSSWGFSPCANTPAHHRALVWRARVLAATPTTPPALHTPCTHQSCGTHVCMDGRTWIAAGFSTHSCISVPLSPPPPCCQHSGHFPTVSLDP